MHIPNLVEIHWRLLKLSPGSENMGVCRADNSIKIWRNLPISNPNQIFTISMHIPCLVRIHWCLLKLSPGNQSMGLSQADNSVKIRRNLPISNPKPDLYNINAHTKFGEYPLTFTQVIIRKRKTDGRTDRHTDVQRETIIPRNYRVAGYKNKGKYQTEMSWCCLINIFNAELIIQQKTGGDIHT